MEENGEKRYRNLKYNYMTKTKKRGKLYAEKDNRLNISYQRRKQGDDVSTGGRQHNILILYK